MVDAASLVHPAEPSRNQATMVTWQANLEVEKAIIYHGFSFTYKNGVFNKQDFSFTYKKWCFLASR